MAFKTDKRNDVEDPQKNLYSLKHKTRMDKKQRREFILMSYGTIDEAIQKKLTEK